MIVHPSPPAGSALRQRMIEDMTVRGFTAKTQHDYIRSVPGGCALDIENDPLIQRAEKAMTEAAQLCQRLLEAQEQVRRQVQEMARIEAELDPLLPHPPDELGRLREVLAQGPAVEEQEPVHAGQSHPG